MRLDSADSVQRTCRRALSTAAYQGNKHPAIAIAAAAADADADANALISAAAAALSILVLEVITRGGRSSSERIYVQVGPENRTVFER